ADDLLLYEEADEAFWLGLTTSKDRAFHFLLCQTADTTEVWALASDAPRAPLIPIASRATKHVYAPEHHDGEFLILTNEDAPNFKLMAAPVANPARANWREVIPHDPAVLLYVVEPFARHLVIYGREKGFSQIWVRDMATGATTPVPFAEETYTAGLTSKETGGGNPEFAAARVRVTYSSLVTPESVYEIDLESGQSSLLAQMEILGGHDPGRYVTERLFATAPDGTQIPISLVYLRDAPPDLPPGPRPLRLDGYGGYAQSQDPTFVPSRLSLIDRGISYAIAHVRGGFELGGHWWEEGRLLNKKNCFSDFIACAEHLIAWGHTAPGRLAIYGSSNGGLLMGVVANQRPDLFRAVVAEVPLVDVPLFLLRTGAIGLSNQSELGDPGDAEVLEYQLSYSPYQNVVPQVYPAIFATGGFNDTNIPYWMPAKWMAKLRDSNSGEHPLLLRLLAGGHLGETSYTEFERETALIYAFVINALGLAGPPLRASDAAAPPSAVNRPDAATQDAAAIPAR
ncbi:MAG: prolyl oligopeptidase family serine peptidase, partial [Thermomicrobiales bacterium]